MRETHILPIPNPQNKLEIVNHASGLTREQAILEYCMTPKTIGEIAAMLGLERDRYRVVKDHLKPLIREYKLKMTIPEFPTSLHQKFVNAETDVITASEEEILAFCKKPRSKEEISKHFGLSQFQRHKHIQPLIDSGKLIGNAPRYKISPRQKFVNRDVNLPIAYDDAIIEFCKTPRTRFELADNFRIGVNRIREYIQPLIDEGKLMVGLGQLDGTRKRRLQQFASK